MTSLQDDVFLCQGIRDLSDPFTNTISSRRYYFFVRHFMCCKIFQSVRQTNFSQNFSVREIYPCYCHTCVLTGNHPGPAEIPPLSPKSVILLIIAILTMIFAVWFNHCCSCTVNASEVAILFFVYNECPSPYIRVINRPSVWKTGSPVRYKIFLHHQFSYIDRKNFCVHHSTEEE